MDRMQQIQALIDILLEEMPGYAPEAAQIPHTQQAQRSLLRGLMNLRPPAPLRPDFLSIQNDLLSSEREERGTVDADALPVTAADPRLALWRGDITRLAADAIVNAANSGMTGCYCPCHGCIDNAIHSAAGLQLRQACRRLMAQQGHPEPTGQAKLTGGYCLPCRHVLHTVGPIINGPLRQRDCALLASCYRSCLELARRHDLHTVAFCCISTGEFHFPNQRAAQVAVSTVKTYLDQTGSRMKVIFNVFKQLDDAIYRRLLGPDQAAQTGD